MSDYFGPAGLCGRDITIRSAQLPSGRTVRGYIQPMDPRNAGEVRRRLRPGTLNAAEYLLIAGPSALTEGETEVTVSSGGRLYELVRAESFGVGGAVGHWEGVLRLKEAAGDG